MLRSDITLTSSNPVRPLRHPPATEKALMKIGAVYPQIELRGDPEAVRRIGTSVGSLGFDYLLTYDHENPSSRDRTRRRTPSTTRW